MKVPALCVCVHGQEYYGLESYSKIYLEVVQHL